LSETYFYFYTAKLDFSIKRHFEVIICQAF